MTSVLQDWVMDLTLMMQSNLLCALRGEDGQIKNHPAKNLVRQLRRAVLLTAFEREALWNPWQKGGGGFTGPLPSDMTLEQAMTEFLNARDNMHLHYFQHFMHGAEIIGYFHPDEFLRFHWHQFYCRCAESMHLWIETKDQLKLRLGDNKEQWLARTDRAEAGAYLKEVENE